MASLFNEISGGRPEHVAKGALVYLLRRDRALRSAIVDHCGRTGFDVDNAEVWPEVPEGENGWRADIVMTEPGGKSIALELKLGAPFTANQREALADGEVALVIAPDRNVSLALSHGTKVMTWKELLAKVSVSDPPSAAAALLLGEAAESFGWYLETITAQEIQSDAAAMFDLKVGEDRDWSQSYRFINQVHAHLESMVPHGCYTPSERRMAPNRKYAHYGYYFSLRPSTRKKTSHQCWIGLNREDGKLAFRLYLDETTIKREWSVDGDLSAKTIAVEALEALK